MSYNIDWTTSTTNGTPASTIDTTWSDTLCQAIRFGKIVDLTFRFKLASNIAQDATADFFTGLPAPANNLAGIEIGLSGRSTAITMTLGSGGKLMVYGIHEAMAVGATVHGHFTYLASSAS